MPRRIPPPISFRTRMLVNHLMRKRNTPLKTYAPTSPYHRAFFLCSSGRVEARIARTAALSTLSSPSMRTKFRICSIDSITLFLFLWEFFFVRDNLIHIYNYKSINCVVKSYLLYRQKNYQLAVLWMKLTYTGFAISNIWNTTMIEITLLFECISI